MLKSVGAATLVGAVGSTTASAATGFAKVSTPTQKGVQSVVVTKEGPYAVAGSGDVLARRRGGWDQSYEKVLDAGLTTQGKNFYGAAVSDDGRNCWVVGESGVVGQYDVVDEQFTDYSQPNDATSTWYDVAVTGAAGDETVHLVNGSGEYLTGEKTAAGGMDWGTASVFNAGNSIRGLVMRGDGSGWTCDTAGQVYETTDGGSTWRHIGIDAASVSLYDIAESGGSLVVAGGNGYLYEYDGSTWTGFQPSQNSIYGVDWADGERMAVGGNGVIYERKSSRWETTNLSTSKTLNDVALDSTGEYPDSVVGNAGYLYERGEFTDYPDRLRVETGVTSDIDYSFDVTGAARKASAADAGDSISTNAGTATVSGTVGGADTADAYDYGGTVGGFSVTSGSAADLTTTVSGTETSPERLTDRSWTSVSVPVSVTLHEVVESNAGLYAVGGSGRVVTRDAGSWVEVDSDGPGGGGNTLYGAGVTDDGAGVWLGGGSGALGKLDPATNTVTDYTAPDNHTSTWTDLAVAGADGSEVVFLVNGSGEVVKGTNSGGTMSWDPAVKPGNGSTIRGVTFLDTQTGYVCDGNAKVYETTDGGDTWTDIGIDGGGVTLYDVAAVSPDDITVVGGSGKLFRYNGAVWTTTKLGGNSRYSVDRLADRGVAVGGGAQVFERELSGWEKTTDDSSDVGLQGTLITSDPDVPKVAVGGNGVILEQSFDDPLY